MELTVVICTYRRPELLDGCLASLESSLRQGFRTLVVDNAGTAACRAVAERHGATYVHEPSTGLSHARNRGWREATTEWLLYLDDDARLRPDTIDRLWGAASVGDYAAAGGGYDHCFASPPPEWLRRYYRAGVRPGDYLLGGLLLVRRAACAALGGFDPALGMRGERTGYAEENEFQDRLRAAGYRLLPVPEAVMDHLVHPRKYKLRQRIGAMYAHGRDGVTSGESKFRTVAAALVAMVRTLVVTLPVAVVRWLLRRDFYWQNAVHSVVGQWAFSLGRLGVGLR